MNSLDWDFMDNMLEKENQITDEKGDTFQEK